MIQNWDLNNSKTIEFNITSLDMSTEHPNSDGNSEHCQRRSKEDCRKDSPDKNEHEPHKCEKCGRKIKKWYKHMNRGKKLSNGENEESIPEVNEKDSIEIDPKEYKKFIKWNKKRQAKRERIEIKIAKLQEKLRMLDQLKE